MYVKIFLLVCSVFIIQCVRKSLIMCATQRTGGVLLKMLKYFVVILNHSHKKRRDSLDTRVVLLVFLLEFEVSGAALHEIHQNRKYDCLQ